jgi:hypothetical protein
MSHEVSGHGTEGANGIPEECAGTIRIETLVGTDGKIWASLKPSTTDQFAIAPHRPTWQLAMPPLNPEHAELL